MLLTRRGGIIGSPCSEAGSFLSAFWKFRTADSSSFLLYTVAPILVPYAIFQAGRCRALHRYTRTAHETALHNLAGKRRGIRVPASHCSSASQTAHNVPVYPYSLAAS